MLDKCYVEAEGQEATVSGLDASVPGWPFMRKEVSSQSAQESAGSEALWHTRVIGTSIWPGSFSLEVVEEQRMWP